MLGDSQISFGAGQVYLEFFDELIAELPNYTSNTTTLNHMKGAKAAAIGVRSTSLQHWTTRAEGRVKNVICEIDKRWGVNAGVYGIQNNRERKYVNIGQGEAYQFCVPYKSAFEAMFENGYYKPDLLVLAFLGNSADRWANSAGHAIADVRATMMHIPVDQPCIFLTTSPSYLEEINQVRWKAQAEIERAFKSSGSHCSFVSGFTKETISAAQGNNSFFKTDEDGVVTDVHHPNLEAARAFFKLKELDLIKAVVSQLDKQ